MAKKDALYVLGRCLRPCDMWQCTEGRLSWCLVPVTCGLLCPDNGVSSFLMENKHSCRGEEKLPINLKSFFKVLSRRALEFDKQAKYQEGLFGPSSLSGSLGPLYG